MKGTGDTHTHFFTLRCNPLQISSLSVISSFLINQVAILHCCVTYKNGVWQILTVYSTKISCLWYLFVSGHKICEQMATAV